MYLVLGTIFVLAGLLTVRIGRKAQQLMGRLQAEGHEAEAHVQRIEKQVLKTTSNNTRFKWDVHFTFTTRDGQQIAGTQRYSGPNRLPAVGDVVSVTYFPDDPNTHRFSREVTAGWVLWAYMGFGLGIALVGLGLLINGMGVV